MVFRFEFITTAIYTAESQKIDWNCLHGTRCRNVNKTFCFSDLQSLISLGISDELGTKMSCVSVGKNLY